MNKPQNLKKDQISKETQTTNEPQISIANQIANEP
jgi:hypothetical protein